MITKNGTKGNETLLILGAAESGVGAALLAKKNGYQVFVSDIGKIDNKYKKVLLNAEIDFEEGKHSTERCMLAAEAIKSPGIPDNSPLVVKLNNNGVQVISEIEFAARYTNAAKVCVTGSNGKTTTTLMIHHILKRSGLNVGLAGNVGKSFAWQVAENNFDRYALEISSFQLDGMFDFRADIAILTNITPDHLDRYEYSFEKYISSKFRILNNQKDTDAFVYCDDDPVIIERLKNLKVVPKPYPFSIKHEIPSEGAFLQGKEIIVRIHKSELIMSIETLALQGKHNIYNSMASAIAARILDLRKKVIKEAMTDFQGAEHRLEFVTKVHGIDFINDSKATNVNSVWYALESMTHPVIWIAGGLDKGNDYSVLKPLVKSKVKAIICLGIDNTKLHKEFNGLTETILDTKTAEDAVKLAYSLGLPGDVVLLSPACASFDLFTNFEERGNQFKRAVFNL